ncbi:hypothetical protein RF11_05478 [Thelohanellus kitauei]|uniref:DDE-1 domain-containing protein n=1 Tax=Thelohanellus kitauei TaxID=669202 RepID=A0A0C2IHB3_THEKT|nr:hypothetical protein RF11_05478 [Thelohanellus kitauei]
MPFTRIRALIDHLISRESSQELNLIADRTKNPISRSCTNPDNNNTNGWCMQANDGGCVPWLGYISTVKERTFAHSSDLSTYVYLLRISAHRFNCYHTLRIGGFMGTLRDPTQPPRATIARHYGVHRRENSCIYKIKELILQNWHNNTNQDRKRKRTHKAEDVEGELMRWFSNAMNRHLSISELNGEKQDADYFGAESWSNDAPSAVINDYEAKDIFNADETGLYSHAIPEETLSFKQSETAACKMAKERATPLFACNMDESENLKTLTIGISPNPRCFKNVKTLPVDMKLTKFVDDKVYLNGSVE